jgi:carboxyl-terminal processing protease
MRFRTSINSIMKKRIILSFAALLIVFTGFKTAEDYFEVTKNLDIFATVYREVNVSYVDEVKPGELIRVAIDGMLKSLDPYTNFYSEAQAEDYRYQVTGTYAGIGSTVRKQGKYIIINQPYEGFPAQRAGLRSGDRIIQVDGKVVTGKKSSDLSKLLKGTAGTPITLIIDRPEIGEKSITFNRAKIQLKNVPYFGKINDITGYIKLTGFTPNAGKEVADAYRKLKEQDISQVILDLRGNGGGLLHEAINIVNVFMPKGKKVVSTKGREKEKDKIYKTLNNPVDTEMPLIVLINGRSASASEIVSGSIQDFDRGVLLGTKSFGKGLVQTTRMLSYNTQMKITTSKYYIPSGRCIQKLDYSHKKNGKAVVVSDSLKRTFLTKNGRKVLDGEGVTPDVKKGPGSLAKVSQSLIRKDLIFDYATHYRNKTDSIVEPKEFDLGDADFEDFLKYIHDKDYTYETETEKALSVLEKKSKNEKYFDAVSSQLVSLHDALKSQKKNDIQKFKEEILEILETEISRRYYYQRAMVESSFDNDDDIQESLLLFADQSRYQSILAGN